MIYFWYEKSLFGWCACGGPKKPHARKADGRRTKIAGVQELAPDEQKLTLSELSARYPSPTS